MSGNGISRRYFFFGSLLAGAMPVKGFRSVPSLKALGYRPPNEKLNIASIGAGGKAESDIAACARTENIVALCDVDEKRAANTYAKYPQVPKYKDFRVMLEKEDKNIDAVIVTIPDFMHATAAIHCMERGKHVYVQKPLAHTVWECRKLREAARNYKVATQMGNQGYSNEGTRQCAEMIWAGEIGNVTEVHAWTNRPVWPQGLPDLPPSAPVPPYFDWDLWLGIDNYRPYSPAYAPFTWRGFFDFGCGALGDMACHILGAPNMALRLTAPTSVECIKIEGASKYYYPSKAVIRFDFPARDNMPPVTIYWYDAMMTPPPVSGIAPGEILGDLPRDRQPPYPLMPNAEPRERQIIGGVFTDAALTPHPLPPAPEPKEPVNPQEREIAERIRRGSNGSLFVGEKGFITTGTYGEWTRLVPMEKMRDYQFPREVLTRSPGHYEDWIRACKGGDPACSNFEVAAPFTEWILLGALSIRCQGKLEWDSENMRITNNQEANEMLSPTFRPGWTLS
jgi:predicted dehydrogenase